MFSSESGCQADLRSSPSKPFCAAFPLGSFGWLFARRSPFLLPGTAGSGKTERSTHCRLLSRRFRYSPIINLQVCLFSVLPVPAMGSQRFLSSRRSFPGMPLETVRKNPGKRQSQGLSSAALQARQRSLSRLMPHLFLFGKVMSETVRGPGKDRTLR